MKPLGYKPHWEHVCLALPALALMMLICAYLLGWLDGSTTTVLLILPSVFFAFMGFGTALLSRSATRLRISYALIPLILASLLLLTSFTQWPMRVAFALNRHSLDALSQRVRAGESISTPIQAGTFRIAKAELSSQGIVCLWTTHSPGGSTGFVQCPPDHVPFNLWSMTSMNHQWQFISED
ncbi:MAG TPA: hypothetical protein VGH19_03835 [Verrucomicrobiae bacterium]